MSKSLSAGEVIEVTTDRIAYGGDAVARAEGMVIFIPQAAPGERLRVRITEKKKNFARAVIEEILLPAPERREPPCRYFGECGGCQLQHIDYRAQLKAKAGFISESLARIGRIDWPHPIEVKSASEFGYRSRTQIKLEKKTNNTLLVGFNRAGSHTVCDVESCSVLEPGLNDALSVLRSKMAADRRLKQAVTDPRLLTEIEIASGDRGIAFEPELPGLPAGELERRIGPHSYRFSPTTFFQVNASLLEDMISDTVGTAIGELAIDLYAGVGLFTLPLASRYNRVIGVESDRRAARFAGKNITANKVTNVEFLHARVEDWLKQSAGQHYDSPDLILLDPPRAGAQGAVKLIAELNARYISYVSCDPTTLARDLRSLCDAGYKLNRVSAFDLFPQTYHIETVVRLERQ